MTESYGLYSHSHWQGAGADKIIATGSKALCDKAINVLSTCSFCRPGKSQNYSVGECYVTHRIRYKSHNKIAEIPDEASEWEVSDWFAWLRDNA